MNEDYYYSTDSEKEMDAVVMSSDYYSPAPYTRYQYFKSVDMKGKRRSFRAVGIAVIVILIIDFLRIYVVNWEYDIESFLKLYMFLGGAALIGEVINQRLVNPIICFVCCFCCIVIAYCSTRTFLFLIIPGLVNMILEIIHFEQCKEIERKWKLYMDVNNVNNVG